MGDLPAQYLRGIDLFNAGEFFESHEILEELWLKAEGVEREFLHALIQAAAALHHFQHGNRKGAGSVFERARRKFEKLPPIVMRLDTEAFAKELENFFLKDIDLPGGDISFPQIKLQDQQ